MSHLSLSGIVVDFDGTAVLRGITLDVPQGGLVAVVGPSGCGKTTLLRTIAGLVRASSGEIRIGRRMVTTHGIHLSPERRRVGWVPQDAALFPHLTVAENIAFGLGGGIRAARRAARGHEVQRLLDLVNMAELADRVPSQLSGGQAQRVALARALAVSPEVVLLDEPFSALDPVLRNDLRAEVRALLAAQQVTGILVTHDQAEALSIADYVAVMREGEILQYGPPAEVYQRPRSPWVAGFVGDSVFLPGIWRSGNVDCSLGSLDCEWMPPELPTPDDGDAVTVLIRPEQLVLGAATADSVIATVTTVSYSGHDALLQLRLDDGTRVASRVAASGVLPVGSIVAIATVGRVLAYQP